MRIKSYLLFCVCFVLVTMGCSSPSVENKETELTISAAASLKDALEEIEEMYEQQSDVNLLINFGASGTLSKQIEQGAPVDVFLSADEDYFASLVDKKLIHKEETVKLLKNELVIIAPIHSKFVSIEEVNQTEKIAIGMPETVPAGKYAKQALEKDGLWKQIEDQVIYAKDVRQVLSYVETGNVSIGVVYKTDATITDKVKIIETIAPSLHSPIVYPVGIIQSTKNKEEAIDLYHFLQTEQSLSIFKKYGFHKIA